MKNLKTLFGLILCFLIGFGCSLLKIPVPAPPVLVGALLVLAMTSGYILTDRFICPHRPKSQLTNSGGPIGHAEEGK